MCPSFDKKLNIECRKFSPQRRKDAKKMHFLKLIFFVNGNTQTKSPTKKFSAPLSLCGSYF